MMTSFLDVSIISRIFFTDRSIVLIVDLFLSRILYFSRQKETIRRSEVRTVREVSGECEKI